MPRLAILNMLVGFSVLFLAAAAGAFVATEMTHGYLRDQSILDSWLLTLQKSAHGHTNLFALMHIVFGLTLPYSVFSNRSKLLQTVGLSLGTCAMAIVLPIRGLIGPIDGVDVTEVVLGAFLSCALVAIAMHAAGLAAKLLQRA